MRRWGLGAAGVLALLCSTAAAQADDAPAGTLRPLWEAGLGVGGLRLPHYRGADQSHNWLLPVPYFVYRGDILKADRDGARALLFESEHLHFDLSAAASAPTRSRDNLARQGMPDLAPTLEVGPNLNWTWGRGRLGASRSDWKLDLRVPVRAAVTLESRPKHIGWSSTPHLNLDVGHASGWNMGLQAGPVWGDRSLNDHFYGVSPALATATRGAYAAPGGWGGWQSTAALSRRFPRHWVGMYVRLDSLQGARFTDSPLVRQRQHLSVGIATSWVLSTSDRLVPTAD
ncbi:MAG: MipA/OmpV family protein [Pseudomonadota bacterium]